MWVVLLTCKSSSLNIILSCLLLETLKKKQVREAGGCFLTEVNPVTLAWNDDA